MLECVKIVVEGEAEEFDAAGLLFRNKILHYAEIDHFVETVAVACVEQVKINIIGAQSFELLGKKSLGVVERVNCPERELGREIETVAGILLHHAADKRLTGSVVIGISGIKVGYAGSVSAVEHLLSNDLVDLTGFGGDAHAAESQQ